MGANSMERCTALDRYVAFHTTEALDPVHDTNGKHDVYLRDLATGQVELVSVNTTGLAAGNNMSVYGLVSQDARYVVFASQATNLVAADTNATWDVFRRDRVGGTTVRLSVDSSGLQGNGSSTWPAMSLDGNLVAFTSTAKNLVAGDTNNQQDIFVRDVASGTTTRVAAGNNACFQPAVSGDGRYVAFTSQASNLVVGDTNGVLDAFLYDRDTSTLERLSVATDGTQSDLPSYMPSVSDDGQRVAFDSGGTTLVAGDTNGVRDVFVRDRVAGTTTRVSVSQNGIQADGNSFHCSLTRAGDRVAFSSEATNLVPGDTNGARDIFWREVGGGTTRITMGYTGNQAAGGASGDVFISADGSCIAFESSATNLVSGDTNGQQDVFAWDRATGLISRVSRTSSGTQATGGHSYATGISWSGSTVGFYSFATNLVTGDTNGQADSFVHNRRTGATARISLDSAEAESNGGFAADGSPSADGNLVAFHSLMTTLVAGDTNSLQDVFLRDRAAGTTTRVNVSSSGAQATGGSSQSPYLSADGRYVAFHSLATNLVSGDTNGQQDIFVRDRQASTTQRVSLTSTGLQATGGASATPGLSADGRYVVFRSLATNLVAGDTNAASDIFVHDRQTGETTRVSVATDGTEGNAASAGKLSLSADGRYVMFTSDATNLVEGDTNASTDVFVRDRLMGTTSLVSVDSAGVLGDGASTVPTMTADGRYVAFPSGATNLVAGDTNALADIFLRDRAETTLVRASQGLQGSGGDGDSDQASWNQDGTRLLYRSSATNLDWDEQDGATRDLMLYDPLTGASLDASRAVSPSLARINLNSSGEVGDQEAGAGVLVADGNSVVFESAATNLVAGDTNGALDLFLRNLRTGAVTRVSLDSSGLEGNGNSDTATVSADGRFLCFRSDATNLVSGDTNGKMDVFVRDLELGTTTRVSVSSKAVQSNGHSYHGQITSDGNFVVFLSEATNLVSGDTNAATDVFVHDRRTGGTVRASLNSSETQANGACTSAFVSRDGRYVVFTSQGTNLVSGDTNGVADVFVRDFWEGTTALVSLGSLGNWANGACLGTWMSQDGRYVAFESSASNLTDGDVNGASDAFLRDLVEGTTTRLSLSAVGDPGNGSSSNPRLSPDRRRVVFESEATNLVAGDTNGVSDVFVRDLGTGAVLRLSQTAAGVQADGSSAGAQAVFSADGRFVSFLSQATNLVSGDTNGRRDLFLRSVLFP